MNIYCHPASAGLKNELYTDETTLDISPKNRGRQGR